MYVVGLTGGIGSGKSTVAEVFISLGIEVVDADIASRMVVEPGTEALEKIHRHFGQDALLANGSMNRQVIRTKVFNNEIERKWLEVLLHPLIREQIKSQLSATSSTYAVLESPLLFETNQHELTDRTLVVDVSETIQLERVLSRDNSSEQEIRAIMAAQLSRKKRQAMADDIILNDQDQRSIKPAVLKLHEQYLGLAKQKI